MGSDSGCKWTEDEKVTCEPGVHQCVKVDDTKNGNITRSCAYWKMSEETYQEEILKSGKCWAYASSTSSKAEKFGLKRMKDTWQCGCNGGLCNGGQQRFCCFCYDTTNDLLNGKFVVKKFHSSQTKKKFYVIECK